MLRAVNRRIDLRLGAKAAQGPTFFDRKSQSGSAGKLCAIGNAVADLVDGLAEIVKRSECAADM
jgi:hypothetical protein